MKFNKHKINSIQSAIIVFSIIVLVNIIGQFIYTRIDLTKEKRYTLSAETKKLIKKIDDQILFKVYLEGDFPADFKRLSKSTREMLDEFRAYNDNIQYEFINPAKANDIKSRNEFYQRLVEQGLTPTDINVKTKSGQQQQRIFPWIIVSYNERELPVSLIETQIGATPDIILSNSEQALEYTLASAIKKITTIIKPKIAFSEGHKELSDIEIADIFKTLNEYYDVSRVKIDNNIHSLTEHNKLADSLYEINNLYKLLIVAKPDSAFSEREKFVIDQFIMNGGSVLWLIDPVFASMDSMKSSPTTIGITNDLNMNDQFFSYGVRLNNNLLLDVNSIAIPIVTGKMGDQPQFTFYSWRYFPLIISKSKHSIVNNLNAIKTEFVSSIDTIEVDNIKKTFLLSTSEYTNIVNTPIVISLELLNETPTPEVYSKGSQNIAVLLEGKFKSLYKNRMSDDIITSPEIGFKTESVPTKMIFISDGDIIKNQVQYSSKTNSYFPLPLGFDKHTNQTYGNKNLILNAVNYLVNDSDGLLFLRNKEYKIRKLNMLKAQKEMLFWQIINIILPILLVITFGFIQFLLRKRKYSH